MHTPAIDWSFRLANILKQEEIEPTHRWHIVTLFETSSGNPLCLENSSPNTKRYRTKRGILWATAHSKPQKAPPHTAHVLPAVFMSLSIVTPRRSSIPPILVLSMPLQRKSSKSSATVATSQFPPNSIFTLRRQNAELLWVKICRLYSE